MTLSVKHTILENSGPVQTGSPFYNSKPIKEEALFHDLFEICLMLFCNKVILGKKGVPVLSKTQFHMKFMTPTGWKQ